MNINTVTGPISTDALGPTLMHEHISCADWSLRAALGTRYFDPEQTANRAVEMFTKMRDECGITTVVDGTPINLGRDVALIREVAERTGLNIIVSTGFYYQPEPALAMRPAEDLIEWMFDECANGITDTDIKPGIMKAAVDVPGLTPYLRKVLTAVGAVAARADLPIFCHHNPSLRDGGDILDIFESQGVAPNRIIIGHSGDTDDLPYLQSLLARGCYIGMDRFGYCAMTLSLERRVATIAALCKLGWAGRLFLSHDLAAFLGMGAAFGTIGDAPDYTFIHSTVRPALLAAGVSSEVFEQMIEVNPAEFFSGAS